MSTFLTLLHAPLSKETRENLRQHLDVLQDMQAQRHKEGYVARAIKKAKEICEDARDSGMVSGLDPLLAEMRRYIDSSKGYGDLDALSSQSFKIYNNHKAAIQMDTPRSRVKLALRHVANGLLQHV